MTTDQGPPISKWVRLVPVAVFAVAAVAHFAVLPLQVIQTWWIGAAVGALVIGPGGALVGWAAREMERNGIDPGFAAIPRLVTSGPFAISRNPMYLGSTVMYAGLSFVVNSWWPLLLLPVLLVSITYSVITREERYLENILGDDYRAYRGNVRRWI